MALTILGPTNNNQLGEYLLGKAFIRYASRREKEKLKKMYSAKNFCII